MEAACPQDSLATVMDIHEVVAPLLQKVGLTSFHDVSSCLHKLRVFVLSNYRSTLVIIPSESTKESKSSGAKPCNISVPVNYLSIM